MILQKRSLTHFEVWLERDPFISIHLLTYLVQICYSFLCALKLWISAVQWNDDAKNSISLVFDFVILVRYIP